MQADLAWLDASESIKSTYEADIRGNETVRMLFGIVVAQPLVRSIEWLSALLVANDG